MNLEVDAGRVMSAAGVAAASANTLSTEVNAMARHLNALQECWKGSAAQNFQVVISDWEVVANKVNQSLDSIRTALQTAAQQYSEVEAANTRLFVP